MGASPLMNIGLRAMTASYAALQTTGHNIANANVAGYSRQQVELATSQGQYTGAGFFGKGVDVATVSRSHNEFLTREASTTTALASMDAARQSRLTQLEKVFLTGESGLGYAAGQFLNAMVDLASRPGDMSTRQVVLARGEDMARRFSASGEQLQSLQAGVTQDLKASISTINGLAKSIARVNDDIAKAAAYGQPPNDLLDQRDQLIQQLSGFVQVSTVPANDGTLGVFIAGGQRLVLGTQADEMQVIADPSDPTRSAVTISDGKTQRVIPGENMGGGSIAGLLRFQNEDLVDARNLIGQLATAVTGAVNAQQILGVNLHPAGTSTAQPMFEVGPTLAIPATTNAREPDGTFSASVSLTITDPSGVRAADYDLRPDPNTPGAYQLTRLSNPPEVRTVASGDIVDGMRIDVTGSLGATDRFLLQPVGQAALGMKQLLANPLDLAAAAPLTATLGNTNTGTASVASLTMNAVPAVPDGTATITFTSDTGDYTWDLLDADGNWVADGAGTWTGASTIPSPPDDINGFTMKLAGVPKNGDTVTVQPTLPAYVSSNNGNAQALAALRDAMLVGRTPGLDGALTGGATITDAYSAALADVGVRVQTANASARISGSLANQALQTASSESGVNLDEEAARLIQYQQSYQAAAKVLQVAQQVFQTLLETAAN